MVGMAGGYRLRLLLADSAWHGAIRDVEGSSQRARLKALEPGGDKRMSDAPEGYGDGVGDFIPADSPIARLSINVNAVLVQLLPDGFDDDGNALYRRVVSIICVDDEMLGPLRDEARRLL